MRMRRTPWNVICLIATAAGLTPGALGAALVSFTGGRPTDVENKGSVNTTFGFRIRLTEPLIVTHLGVYDTGGNGLDQVHPVGLWNGENTLLASATVPAGTAAAISDGYRYVPLTESVTLSPGVYDLGAHYYNIQEGFGDPYFELVDSVTLPAGAAFETALIKSSFFGLTHPVEPIFGNFGTSFFGPGALYTAVPEPTTIGMASALTLATGIWSSRRRWRTSS